MNPEWLRYFIALAETRNFHAAGDRLFVTPQAISRALGLLEDQLKVRLVERDHRVRTLTGAGEALLEEARNIVKAHDNAARRMAEWQDGEPRGPVSIATIGVWHYYLLPPLLKRLLERYPRIRPRLYSMAPPEAEQRVAAGEIDIGILLSPPTRQGLACHVGLSTPYRIAGSPQPLASWQDFGYIVPGIFGREAFQAFDGWPQERFPRRVVAEVEMLESIIRLAEAGVGAAFLPELAIRERVARGTLAVVAEAPFEKTDQAHVISRKGIRATPAAREALALLCEGS